MENMADNLDEVKFIKIDKEINLPVGKSRRVEAGQFIISLWHLEDGYFAIEDECPHQGDSLSGGVLESEGIVACPWHGAQFEIRTGKVISLPATCGVRTFPTMIIEGEVYVSSEPHSDTKPKLYELK